MKLKVYRTLWGVLTETDGEKAESPVLQTEEGKGRYREGSTILHTEEGKGRYIEGSTILHTEEGKGSYGV